MSIEDQLRSYGSILDQRPAEAVEMIELTQARTRRSTNRRRALWGISAALSAMLVSVAIIWAQPGHRVTTAPTATTAPSSPATTTAPTLPADLPRHFTVVKSLPGGFAPDSMATSDGDVWLVEGITSLAGSPGSQIERRDATTGTLKATIAIPGQETVFAIAADGAGHIYVAGGGDGGVPRTTVSRVSTASDHLDYTAMLPSNATCSCPLAATADGVWLSGNGSTTAVVLDPASARVDAFVSLPAPSTVLSVVGSTIAIGLRDARVAIIDAATRQIVHVDAIGDNAVEPAGRVVAISPYRATSTTWNAWITRGDGLNLILRPNGTTIRAAFLGLAPDATATTASGEFLYFVATNALGARSSQDRVAGFANYDPLTNAFGFVVPSSGIASPPGGFDDVVSVGDSLWVKFGDSPGGTVLLVRPQ